MEDEPSLFQLHSEDQVTFPTLKNAYMHYFGRISRNTSRAKWTPRILIVSNSAIFIADESQPGVLARMGGVVEPLSIKRPVPISQISQVMVETSADKVLSIVLAKTSNNDCSVYGPDLRFKLLDDTRPNGQNPTPQQLADLLQTLYHNITGQTFQMSTVSYTEEEIRAKLCFTKPRDWSAQAGIGIPSVKAVREMKRQQQQQATQLNTEGSQWEERVHELSNSNNDLRDENSKLCEQVAKFKVDIEAATAQLQDTKQAKEELERRTDLDEIGTQKEKLEATVLDLKNENKELKDELLDVKNTINQNDAKLLPGVEQLKNKNDELEEQRQQLQETVAQLREQISEIANEKDELHNRSADMNATVANQEQEELSTCHAQIEDLRAKLNNVTQDLMKAQTSLSHVKAETAADIDSLQNKLESSDQELVRAKMVMERAGDEDLNVLRHTLEKKDEELEALRKSLETTKLSRGGSGAKLNDTNFTAESQAISNLSSQQDTTSSFIKDPDKSTSAGKNPEISVLKTQLEKKDKQLNQTKGVLREAFKRQVEELETIRKQFQQYDDQIVAYLERVFNTTSPPPPNNNNTSSQQNPYMFQNDVNSPLVSPVPFYSGGGGGSPSFGSPIPGGYSTSPPPPPPVGLESLPSHYYGYQQQQQQQASMMPPAAAPNSPSPVRVRAPGSPNSAGTPINSREPANFGSGGNYSYYSQYPNSNNNNNVGVGGVQQSGGYNVPLPHSHVAKSPSTASRNANFTPSSNWGLGGGLDKYPGPTGGGYMSGNSNSSNGGQFAPVIHSVHPAAGVAMTMGLDNQSFSTGPLPQHQQATPVQASPVRTRGIFSSTEDSYRDPESSF